MISAGVNELSFEPKMPVILDSAGTTETPENMRPIQGPLVNLRYKPTSWRYNIRLSAAPTVGNVTIEMKSNGVVLNSVTFNVNGVTQLDGARALDLSQVNGESPLYVSVTVNTPADAGITAQVDSVVSCIIPLTSSGSC